MGQITVTATNGMTALFRVPAGLCNVTFWNTASTIYVGTSTAVTASNGLVCHSIPTSFYSYVSSGGTQFYGTVASGTASVNFVISTDQ